MRIRILAYFLLLSLMCVLPLSAAAQMASPAPSAAPTPSTSQPAMSPEMSSDVAAYNDMLRQLQQVAQQTAADLGKMKIDKWKADSNIKQQSQSNTVSLQRNLTAAMPEMIQKAQAAPHDLGPNFKLYRNLNVVFDVLTSTAENAGAFGPKEQYSPLENDIGTLDQLRRSMADRLDWLSGMKDNQIRQLSQQLIAAQQQAKAAAAAATPAQTETPKKKAPVKKKKPVPTGA